jgi:ADP-heptose:LPS heptosyltransferase
MKTITGPVRRIAVIRVRPAGDTILTTPVFRELKKRFPESTVVCILEEPLQELLLNNPHVDEVLTYHRKKVFSYIKLLVRLLFSRFDVAIDLKNNSRSTVISLFTGARYRIGRQRPRNFFYTHKFPDAGNEEYTVISSLSFLRPLGIESRDIRLDLVLSEEEKRKAEECWNKPFAGGKIRCLVYVSGKYPTQRWPKEHFAALIKQLSFIPGISILVAAGRAEYSLSKEICDLSGCGAGPCKDTTLRELAAIISRASVMISADTGPRHFATAFDIPTLTLFTSTSPRVWSPPDLKRNPVITAEGLECLPCHARSCEDLRCLKELSPEAVFKKAKKLIE